VHAPGTAASSYGRPLEGGSLFRSFRGGGPAACAQARLAVHQHAFQLCWWGGGLCAGTFTCVTLLLVFGVPPHIVRQIAGHSDIGVTMKVYAHASLDEQRRALGSLGDRLS
jgi:integrase